MVSDRNYLPTEYRKRPVVVEAWQVPPDDNQTRHMPPPWAARAFMPGDLKPTPGGELEVRTLEDGRDGRARHVADVGDWIIRGVAGELYPCKPEIFAATYEPAAQRDTQAEVSELRRQCDELISEVERMRAELTGPAGYETWKDAAVAERVMRDAAQAEIERLKAALAHAEALYGHRPAGSEA